MPKEDDEALPIELEEPISLGPIKEAASYDTAYVS